MSVTIPDKVQAPATTKVPFFKTTVSEGEFYYMDELRKNPGHFTKNTFTQQVSNWLKDYFRQSDIYLTKSCTQALEIAAMLVDIQPGDEVILPSYAFVACANAFVLRGATCVFVDVEPGTMNIDPNCIAPAITRKTKAIVAINYAGVACNYDAIRAVIGERPIAIIEDNAHGMGATVDGQPLGLQGDIVTLSFDYLKPISCGQGGAILINNKKFLSGFETMYHMGTNKIAFQEGRLPHYEWKSPGQNCYLSEIQAAWLLYELENADKTIQQYKNLWQQYFFHLQALDKKGNLQLMQAPARQNTNGYLFWVKTCNESERKNLQRHLLNKGIETAFHYIPLHQSEYGAKHGRVSGQIPYTISESLRLLRLPLYYGMTLAQLELSIQEINNFYQ